MALHARPARSKTFDAALGLGSNMGEKAANIDRAIALLAEKGDIRIVARSRNYASPPWGDEDQDAFVNACITVATKLSPRALLYRCQAVENAMGRVRTRKWGPRIIDIDILTYRGETIRESDLIVPHPLIAERAFVLLPLIDVAPELKLKNQTLDHLIERLGAHGVEPIAPPAQRGEKKTPPA